MEENKGQLNFAEILNKVISVVSEVATFQLKHFRAVPVASVSMKAAKETVSFVDVESEKMLYEGLSELVTSAGFYGEETGMRGSQSLVWVVDPLDGTTNYLHGVDHFSISVALLRDGVPLLGVVMKPYTGDVFSAYRGSGLHLNGEQLPEISPLESIEQALFITGFPYRSKDIRESFFDAAPEVLQWGRGIRRSGSAALDLSYVAAGWYQGFWESDLQPYDVAAGMLFLEEAGVKSCNGVGEPYSIGKDRVFVAAVDGVFDQLKQQVRMSYNELA